jgi:hypothetical protein
LPTAGLGGLLVPVWTRQVGHSPSGASAGNKTPHPLHGCVVSTGSHLIYPPNLELAIVRIEGVGQNAGKLTYTFVTPISPSAFLRGGANLVLNVPALGGQHLPSHHPGHAQEWFCLHGAGQPLLFQKQYSLARFGWIWLDLAGFGWIFGVVNPALGAVMALVDEVLAEGAGQPRKSAKNAKLFPLSLWERAGVRESLLRLLRFFAAISWYATGPVKRGDGALVGAWLGPVHERPCAIQRWAHKCCTEVRLPYIGGNSINFLI